MRYLVLSKLLFVAILGLSCMGVAVSGTGVGPENIDDGRYIASHTNQNNYTWTLEFTFQNRQIMTTKITVNNLEESVWTIGDLEFNSYSGQLSGWLELQGIFVASRKIIGKFPKIKLWDGGEWGGAKWHLLRSGE